MTDKQKFVKALNKFGQTLTEYDHLMVVHVDAAENYDALTFYAGEWDVFSTFFSTKDIITGGNTEAYYEIRKTILQTALNICSSDKEMCKLFIQQLEKCGLKENSNKGI
jgi:hypothetical protein